MDKECLDRDVCSDNSSPPSAKLCYSLANHTKMFILPPSILKQITLNNPLRQEGASVLDDFADIRNKTTKEANITTTMSSTHSNTPAEQKHPNSLNLKKVVRTPKSLRQNWQRSMTDNESNSIINKNDEEPGPSKTRKRMLNDKLDHLEEGTNVHSIQKIKKKKIDEHSTPVKGDPKTVEKESNSVATSSRKSAKTSDVRKSKANDSKESLEEEANKTDRTPNRRSNRIRKLPDYKDYVLIPPSNNKLQKDIEQKEDSISNSPNTNTKDCDSGRSRRKTSKDLSESVSSVLGNNAKSLHSSNKNNSTNAIYVQNNKNNDTVNSESKDASLKTDSLISSVTTNVCAQEEKVQCIPKNIVKQRSTSKPRMNKSSVKNEGEIPVVPSVKESINGKTEDRIGNASHVKKLKCLTAQSKEQTDIFDASSVSKEKDDSGVTQEADQDKKRRGSSRKVKKEEIYHSIEIRAGEEKKDDEIEKVQPEEEELTEMETLENDRGRGRGRSRGRGRGRGTGRSRGRGRGRGRGRSRGRGRGTGRGKERDNSRDSERESCHSSDLEYVPKNVSSNKAQNESEDDIVNVTCSKCGNEVNKKTWKIHNLNTHNNTAWIKGEHPMDFENDMKLWKRTLLNAHKRKRGKLKCEQCGDIKKSVIGFISHMQFCGKTDEEKRALMITCPDCGLTMMPSSYEVHERVHKQPSKSSIPKETNFSEVEDSERSKRKAAQQALSKISETATILIGDSSTPDTTEKNAKKSIMTMSTDKPIIPGIWKSLWKKELSNKGTTNCRHIGCSYISTSFDDIFQHCNDCSHRLEKNYTCKLCAFSSKIKDEIAKHIEHEHAGDDVNDKNCGFNDESDDNEEEHIIKLKPKSGKQKKTVDFADKSVEPNKSKLTNKLRFLDREERQSSKFGQPYFPSIRWTMEYEAKHYELDLFQEYYPNNFTLLETAEADKCLPELRKSMRSKTSKTKDPEKLNENDPQWKIWNRFEGGFDEDVATFFTGGPIWALAWLPIPAPMYSKDPMQYVALSTHPTMESEYTVRKSYSGRNIIQIWSVGNLINNMRNIQEPPSFCYGIAHDSATVWCLEWCPSGCYQDPNLHNYDTKNNKNLLRRMGMLAAACSDGCVRIYSLPFPEELKKMQKKENNDKPIYDTKPVLMLIVNTSIYDNKEQNWQCTKLSWSKEHGHNTIAAGFSNGYIGLWDLTIKSSILAQKREDTWFVNAFQHFYAHGNAISMVALIPYNGERFLASASVDKSYKFWNLENTDAPQSCVKRGIVTNGAWMLHWPCSIITMDEALGRYKHAYSVLVPFREYLWKVANVLTSNTTAYAFATSDYGNAIAHGTLSGDIETLFPQKILFRSDLMFYMKRLSSCIKTVDFAKPSTKKKETKNKKNSKDYDYLPDTYAEAKDRFGVMFSDRQEDNWQKVRSMSLNVNHLTPIQIEQYPFTSVNTMAWNPNCWSYMWLISGYQSGLVRILSFKYSLLNPRLAKLLPWHAEQMLAKIKTR